jgi:hypothetical protein
MMREDRLRADARAAVCAWLRGSSADAPGVPFETILETARDHRVHLLLAARWPRTELASDLRAAAAIDAIRDVELRRVLDALASAGVQAMLIKGAALAHTHYPQPALRPRIDTDLMIPDAARDRVAQALAALGYLRAIETEGEIANAQAHYERIDALSIHHALDVHWRIANVIVFAGILTYQELARDSVTVPALGAHARAPSATHALMLACIHRVAHHRDSLNLLWLYDIHLLAEAMDETERAALIDLARAHRVRAVCAESLRLAADAFGGLAGDLAARMSPPDGVSEPSQALLAERRRPVDILAADIKALDGWSKRWQLLLEHVFPAREYMFARYGTRRTLSLPWLYVQRIVTGAPKWFRS